MKSVGIAGDQPPTILRHRVTGWERSNPELSEKAQVDMDEVAAVEFVKEMFAVGVDLPKFAAVDQRCSKSKSTLRRFRLKLLAFESFVLKPGGAMDGVTLRHG